MDFYTTERVTINGELFEDLNVAARDVIYQYDELNRLIKATVNGKTIEYIYNGDGLRVGKVEDGKTTRYLYEYDKVVLEVDEAGNQTARNIYGLNLLAREVYNGTIAETMYYLYNGHTDVTALVGETGEVVGTYYYDAFGNILEATGDKDNNIMYAGYQYDEETGLYYLNARFYDPKVARFLQEDTYTGDPMDPLSLNLYSYCHNEPLMYYDPSGHKRVSPDKIEGSFSSDIANLGEEKWVVKSFCEGFVGFFTGTWEGIKNKAKYETQEFKKMCDKPLEYIPNAIRKSLTDPEKYFDIVMIIPGSAQNLKTHISRIYTLATGDKYDIAYMLGGITGEVALDMITSKIFEGVSKTFSKIRNKVKSPIKDNIDITPPNFDEVANGIDLNKIYNDTIDISDIDDLTINIPDAGGSGDNIGNMLHEGKTGNLKITKGVTQADDFAEITLRYKEGMPINEFNRKANVLKDLGDQGLLYKAENPVLRDPSVTRAYRQDMIKRIWNQYGKTNPEFANKLIDRVTTKMQPDHIWELQLGGSDTASNLKFLDSFTNWDIGTQQIRPQIRNLETGTKIKITIEK